MSVKPYPELEQEWLRQNNLGYGALIAIGVVMVQPFLTAASLDLPGSHARRGGRGIQRGTMLLYSR